MQTVMDSGNTHIELAPGAVLKVVAIGGNSWGGISLISGGGSVSSFSATTTGSGTATAGPFVDPVTVQVEVRGKASVVVFQPGVAPLVSGAGNTDGAALLRGGFVLAQRGAPASVTGTTAETLLCPAVVVPAGVLGLNGMLRIESVWSSSGTLNSRIHTIKIGATTVFTRTRNTVASVSEVPLILIQNRGSLSSQLSLTTAVLSYGSNLTAPPATLSIDFSVAQSIYFYGQLGNSADTLTLESHNIRLEVAP